MKDIVMLRSRILVLLPLVSFVALACVTEPLPHDDSDKKKGSGGSAAATGGAGGIGGAGGGMGGVGGALIGDGTTWGNFAQNYFSTYCVSCHNPLGQASADFRSLAVVQMRLNAIRCGTNPTQLDGCVGEHAPGWFPVGNGPKPTDEERLKLVEWIESGAAAADVDADAE